MTKHLETIGTWAGILGAFLVALKFGAYGYPCFFLSSACLLGSAIVQRQANFIKLQGVFFLANCIGLINYL
jgi:hypothetical protein